MYLKNLQIRNFKNHSASSFDFEKGTNTIIGENDSGKSNAMQAIRILLDSEYFYNSKRLKESDFSNELNNWKGHWIIISATFVDISSLDKENEICASIIPEKEDEDFVRSFIRCNSENFGTITLFIRPNSKVRKKLFVANNNDEFDLIRDSITLLDYEFFYTSRSQTDFLDEEEYIRIVGNLDKREYTDPDNEDSLALGSKISITDIWQHISVVFIDALRDVENELKKPKNPLRRAFDVIQDEISTYEKDDIENKITELNSTIARISQIDDIGNNINNKLNEIVGLIYSPEINIESRLKADIQSLSKYLSVSPEGFNDIDLLGLGHLNILYIALKLVEFEYRKSHEVLNIMIIEEPEAHIHIHIQKTLFNNLNVIKNYTQIIMTTHSTHLSEIADISRVNVLKSVSVNSSNSSAVHTVVMKPTSGLEKYAEENGISVPRGVSITACLERYLDAKRSALLFSKGVILVEGDGEEILLPAMVENAFGVSLDEIGISVINIGSVAFEYVSSVFSDDRLQRFCAVITDSDTLLMDAKKSKENASKLGKARKAKLDALSKSNPWIKPFYADYTFEVDFSNISENVQYIKEVINGTFKSQKVAEEHLKKIDGSQIERYDEVLKLAENMGKGWYATTLASVIDNAVLIPKYLCQAIAFAAQEIINDSILKKMAIHVLKTYVDLDNEKLVKELMEPKATISQLIIECVNAINEDDSFSVFYTYLKELGKINE